MGLNALLILGLSGFPYYSDLVKKSLWETHSFHPFWNNWLIFNVLSGTFLPLLIMISLNKIQPQT